MITATIVQSQSGEFQTFSLLVNPITNNKAAKQIFFDLKSTDNHTSIWEIYLGSTISSNGTLQTVVNQNQIDHTDTTSTLQIYKGPTITTYGRLARKFILPGSAKEFSTNAPTLQLEPGQTILVRRITSLGGTITSHWRWQEVPTI